MSHYTKELKENNNYIIIKKIALYYLPNTWERKSVYRFSFRSFSVDPFSKKKRVIFTKFRIRFFFLSWLTYLRNHSSATGISIGLDVPLMVSSIHDEHCCQVQSMIREFSPITWRLGLSNIFPISRFRSLSLFPLLSTRIQTGWFVHTNVD